MANKFLVVVTAVNMVVMLSWTPASGQVANDEALSALACDPALPELSPTRYLRALSLDLRGTVPTLDELNEVRVTGQMSDELIDQWLTSDAFVRQAVRHHEKLLWNNVDNINLVNASFRFTRTRNSNLYWVRNRALRYRGETAPCRNEPIQFDETGAIATDGDGFEGYVQVIPYWSEDKTPIKVCAFDAQIRPVAESGDKCGTRQGSNDVDCGCGPAVRWCSFGQESKRVNRSMREALNRFMASVFSADESYAALFTSRRAFINGALSYFWRHQTGTPAGLVYEPAPLDVTNLPVLPFTADDAWYEIELPEVHSGLLTRPAFLLRFQTNRARANRFFDAFLCQPFNPPEGGLPVADEASARNPDLQGRAGCKYCHSLLEPAASHWGRWTEQGIGFLDADGYPRVRGDCEACALRGLSCSPECRNFYITQSFSEQEDAYLGMLKAYQFRRDDHVRNISVGPRLLALTAIADNSLPRCVARRAAEWLLGQPVDEEKDGAWVDELARQFVFADLSFRSLVKAIVTSPRYRRVR